MKTKARNWNDVKWESADTFIENNTKEQIEERAKLGYEQANAVSVMSYFLKHGCIGNAYKQPAH